MSPSAHTQQATCDLAAASECRAEQEAAEKKKTDLASALQQRKASKKAGLQAEPPAGSPNTAAIRIRLPDGSTAQRRFLADQPLQVTVIGTSFLAAFVTCQCCVIKCSWAHAHASLLVYPGVGKDSLAQHKRCLSCVECFLVGWPKFQWS